jgi:hypothetical protein
MQGPIRDMTDVSAFDTPLTDCRAGEPLAEKHVALSQRSD